MFNESTRWRLPDALADVIAKAAGDDADVRVVSSRLELTAALPETDFLVGLPLPDDQLSLVQGRLRWLQLTSSLGDEEPFLIATLNAGVRVSTAASIRGPSIAEHALALTLALVRRLDLAIAAQSDQKWTPGEIAKDLRVFAGSTMGIIADASLATEIVRRAAAFDVTTLVCHPHDPPEGHGADRVYPFARLRDLIEASDTLIVASARSRATHGLLGRAEFAFMKPGAILVDVGRGGIVSTTALVEALRKGRLAGAALDAFEAEPLPPNSPLWSMPGVIVTPHVSSAGPRYWQAAAEFIADNLRRILDDRPLRDELTLAWYGASSGASAFSMRR